MTTSGDGVTRDPRGSEVVEGDGGPGLRWARLGTAVRRQFTGDEPVPAAWLVARSRGRRGEPEYGAGVGIDGRRGRVTVRRRRCTPAAASARGGGSGMAEWRRQGAGVVSDSATKLGAE